MGGVSSDHCCVYVNGEFPPARGYTWVAKFRQTRTKDTGDAFAEELRQWDWADLCNAESVDDMAEEPGGGHQEARQPALSTGKGEEEIKQR